MLVAAASKHPSELSMIQSWHTRGRRTWRSGWRTWDCLSSLGPPPIYCSRIHGCTYSQWQIRTVGRDVFQHHSYLAMRCASRLKGRLWMKTTPGPVRDALSWLSPCIRWWFSVQGDEGILNTKNIMKLVGKQEGCTHPEDCSSQLGRVL